MQDRPSPIGRLAAFLVGLALVGAGVLWTFAGFFGAHRDAGATSPSDGVLIAAALLAVVAVAMFIVAGLTAVWGAIRASRAAFTRTLLLSSGALTVVALEVALLFLAD